MSFIWRGPPWADYYVVISQVQHTAVAFTLVSEAPRVVEALSSPTVGRDESDGPLSEKFHGPLVCLHVTPTLRLAYSVSFLTEGALVCRRSSIIMVPAI